MEDNLDLELGIDTQPNPTNIVVRKNISLKLKNSHSKNRGSNSSTDISAQKFESSTKENIPEQIFSDISKKPLKLKWDHNVNIIGEKVLDPLIHTCERCQLPILIYGRLFPCKHVFCYLCATKSNKTCPRCNNTVSRVERSELGSVFVCTFGGSKHGTTGCHRTYLSKRDLQAHIQYRHLNQRPPPLSSHATSMNARIVASNTSIASNPHQVINNNHAMLFQHQTIISQSNVMPLPQTNLPPPPLEYISNQHYVTGAPVYLNNPPPQQQPPMLINLQQAPQQQQMPQMIMQQPPPQQQQNPPQNIMVMASRSANLITVPLQDEQSQQQPQQQHYIMQQHLQQGQQQNQYIIAQSQSHVINRPPMINQQSNMPMIGSYQPSSTTWSSNRTVQNNMTSQGHQTNQIHQYY